MPQIGWFEIVIIVILAILIIGPKDFPVMLKKIGKWTASFKNYFYEVQKDIVDVESSFENENPFKKETSKITKNHKKNE